MRKPGGVPILAQSSNANVPNTPAPSVTLRRKTGSSGQANAIAKNGAFSNSHHQTRAAQITKYVNSARNKAIRATAMKHATMRANNKALARALQRMREENRTLREAHLDYQREISDLRSRMATLRALDNIDELFETEVNERVQTELYETMLTVHELISEVTTGMHRNADTLDRISDLTRKYTQHQNSSANRSSAREKEPIDDAPVIVPKRILTSHKTSSCSKIPTRKRPYFHNRHQTASKENDLSTLLEISGQEETAQGPTHLEPVVEEPVTEPPKASQSLATNRERRRCSALLPSPPPHPDAKPPLPMAKSAKPASPKPGPSTAIQCPNSTERKPALLDKTFEIGTKTPGDGEKSMVVPETPVEQQKEKGEEPVRIVIGKPPPEVYNRRETFVLPAIKTSARRETYVVKKPQKKTEQIVGTSESAAVSKGKKGPSDAGPEVSNAIKVKSPLKKKSLVKTLDSVAEEPPSKCPRDTRDAATTSRASGHSADEGDRKPEPTTVATALDELGSEADNIAEPNPSEKSASSGSAETQKETPAEADAKPPPIPKRARQGAVSGQKAKKARTKERVAKVVADEGSDDRPPSAASSSAVAEGDSESMEPSVVGSKESPSMDAGPARRSRRGGALICYKEMSLNKKIRRGDPVGPKGMPKEEHRTD